MAERIFQFLFGLTLSIDSFYFFLGSSGLSFFQTFPVSLITGLPLLFNSLRKINLILQERVIKIFIILYLYLVIIFFFSILIIGNNINLFFEYGIRQLISMFLGLLYLLIFKYIFLTNHAFFLSGLKTSLFLIFFMSCYQFFLEGTRAYGFSSEPSHLAILLSCFFLPVAYFFKLPLLYYFLIIGSLLLTLSFSGFVFFLIIFLSLALIRLTLSKVIMATLLASSFFGIFTYFEQSLLSNEGVSYFLSNISYVSRSLETIFYGELIDPSISGSMVDRFWSFYGPLSFSLLHLNLFGFGFGIEAIYWNQIFSTEVSQYLLEVKSGPSISSHFSKILLYGGIIGIALFWYPFFENTLKKKHLIIFILALMLVSLFSLSQLHYFVLYFWVIAIKEIANNET